MELKRFQNRMMIGVFCFVIAQSAFAGEFYKWTDEEGNVHYSKKAPAGQSADVVRTQSFDNSKALEKLEKDKTTASDNATARQQQKEDQAASAEREKQRKDRCQQSTKNLDGLHNSQRIFDKDESGNRVRISEKQRQQRIDKSRDVMKENCK